MKPRILGVYTSDSKERLGLGGSVRATNQSINWFVIQLSEVKLLLQPLNQDNLPAGFKRVIKLDDFLANFIPEPVVYVGHVLPVLTSLGRKIGKTEGYVNVSQLSDDELTVYDALRVAGKYLSGEAKKALAGQRAVKVLLASLPEPDEVETTYTEQLNSASIDYRKRRKYDKAISFYAKALEKYPLDDHLHFNMARAYYEKGDIRTCKDLLEKAIDMNPGLAEARKFYRFVSKELAEKG